MATIFRLVDPDNVATVRLNLNALETGSTGFGLNLDSDLGDVETTNEWLSSAPARGSKVLVSWDPPVLSTFFLDLKESSLANFTTSLRSLARELSRGGLIEWQPDGAAAPLYCEFHPSPIPSWLRGTAFGGVLALRDFRLLNQPVDIIREPHFRAASASLASATLTNEVGSREISVTNPGSMKSPAKFTLTVAASGADVVQFHAGRKSFLTSALQSEFATNYTSFEIEGATMGTNTASTADANASGGNVALTTYAGTGYFQKRWKKVITPTTPAAFEGQYRIRAIVKVLAGSKQTLQLRWGMRDSDPVDFTEEDVVLDATEASTSIFASVYLGTVNFQSDASVLVLEGWSRLDVDPGSGTLAWDTGVLIPAGEQVITCAVPGFRGQALGKEKWLGNELTTPTSPGSLTAGAEDENTLVLNAQDEAGGTKPNAGIVYPAGKHIFKVLATLQENSGNKTELAELRVRDVTAGSNVVTRNLYAKKNRKETFVEQECVFEADGSSAYQVQVVMTAAAAAGRKVIINQIRHRFIRTVNNSYKIILNAFDPDQNGVYDSSGVKVSHVTVSGPLPEHEPDYAVWVFDFGDWSGLVWQDDVDIREPLAKTVYNRSVAVAIDGYAHHAII